MPDRVSPRAGGSRKSNPICKETARRSGGRVHSSVCYDFHHHLKELMVFGVVGVEMMRTSARCMPSTHSRCLYPPDIHTLSSGISLFGDSRAFREFSRNYLYNKYLLFLAVVNSALGLSVIVSGARFFRALFSRPHSPLRETGPLGFGERRRDN